jgi:hypothetical protein
LADSRRLSEGGPSCRLGLYPPSSNLDQLKRQAKELLRRQPLLGQLRDAQRVIAQQYGFDLWDALRTHVASARGVSRPMIQPDELKSDDGRAIGATITAADAGDIAALRQLLDRDPQLSRAQYWYTQPMHFAVRSGHVDAVQMRLDAGADPEWNGYNEFSLIEMARDRGHERVAQLPEEARQRMRRVAPGDEHPIHWRGPNGDSIRRSCRSFGGTAPPLASWSRGPNVSPATASGSVLPDYHLRPTADTHPTAHARLSARVPAV